MTPSWSSGPPDIVRVMVVDDSIIMRKALAVIISQESDMEVVASARHGQECLEMVRRNRPDIILLDVIMPVMSGLETLSELRKFEPELPVVMFSSVTREGAAVTVEALAKGANDFVPKPSGQFSTTEAVETIRRELIPKIRAHMEARTVHAALGRPDHPTAPISVRANRADVLAIGVSTGGPAALDVLLTALPADFPLPILIVQHMPATFTSVLAQRLDARSAIQVVEATDDVVLRPGLAIVARGDQHLTVVPGRGGQPSVRLDDGLPVNSCKPSVDVLFKSIAAVYGGNAIALVLTGMGSDGLDGVGALFRLGARIIIQDASSSVVWGMPGNVFRAGFAHRVLPLGTIATEILALLDSGRVR